MCTLFSLDSEFPEIDFNSEENDAGEEIVYNYLYTYYLYLLSIIIFYYCSSFPQILICSLTLLIKLAKTELEIFGQTID